MQGQPAEVGVPVALGVQPHRQPCEKEISGGANTVGGAIKGDGAKVGGVGLNRVKLWQNDGAWSSWMAQGWQEGAALEVWLHWVEIALCK